MVTLLSVDEPPRTREIHRPDANTLVVGGLLLTAAPGVGYLIVWIHDFGYENRFHVPPALIAPQLGEILAAAIGLSLITLFAFFSVELYLYVRQYKVGSVEWRLWTVAGAALWFGLVLYSAWGAPWDWSATGLWAAIVFAFAVLLVSPEIFRDRQRHKVQQTARPPKLLTALTRRVGLSPLILGVAVLIVLQGAYDTGIDNARNQAVFLVSDSSPPEVVLAIYGDTVVLAPFDKSTRLVSRDFDIVKIGGQSLHLTRMSIGPLKTQCSDPSIPEGSYYTC